MKISKTRYDTFIEITCLLCLVGVLFYLAITWKGIPAEIPGHYNARGEIDKFTGKGLLIVLPALAWIMYLVMSALERLPQIWNTGVTVTAENRERVYRILKSMLKTTKLIMVAVFTYLTVNSALTQPLSVWFLPVSLALIFGSMTFFIVKLVKNG